MNRSNPSFKQSAKDPARSNENNTADGCKDNNVDFDRRSAGARFASSAYHEFVKVNNVFSTGVFQMRRKSCSQSQSHSRVRIQPSIYHDEDGVEQACSNDKHQSNPITKSYLKVRKSNHQQEMSKEESLGSMLSPLNKYESIQEELSNKSLK